MLARWPRPCCPEQQASIPRDIVSWHTCSVRFGTGSQGNNVLEHTSEAKSSCVECRGPGRRERSRLLRPRGRKRMLIARPDWPAHTINNIRAVIHAPSRSHAAGNQRAARLALRSHGHAVCGRHIYLDADPGNTHNSPLRTFHVFPIALPDLQRFAPPLRQPPCRALHHPAPSRWPTWSRALCATPRALGTSVQGEGRPRRTCSRGPRLAEALRARRKLRPRRIRRRGDGEHSPRCGWPRPVRADRAAAGVRPRMASLGAWVGLIEVGGHAEAHVPPSAARGNGPPIGSRIVAERERVRELQDDRLRRVEVG